jgi:protein LTV1
MVFAEKAIPNQRIDSSKQSSRYSDTASNFSGIDPSAVRPNEGEAAIHGVWYDDTEYDYMQHLRDLSAEGEFIDASEDIQRHSQSLEDALREVSLVSTSNVLGKRSRAAPLLDADVLPNRNLRTQNYQVQQEIPDALAGFQPDMDPRLREVLEALEDDAYVDPDEDGDIFAELAGDGEELSLDEFEQSKEDEEDGWESDATTKPNQPEWMGEYSKFKKGPGGIPSNLNSESIALSASSSVLPRRKKRKGALTDISSYSMSSASLARTEGLTTLDARFDRLEVEYADDDEYEGQFDDSSSIAASETSHASLASYTSTKSTRSRIDDGVVPANFDNMLDEFLAGHSIATKGKRRRGKEERVRVGGEQTGLEQLDEVRRELGPARVKSRLAS